MSTLYGHQPQGGLELLVALKLAVMPAGTATVRRLADELAVAKSPVGQALQRLAGAGLVKTAGEGRRVNRLALRDLIENAVRWLAPARVGPFDLGLPTASSSATMAGLLRGDDEPLVMPLAQGPVRGRTVAPLHPAAPAAAARDPRLLDLLALVDVFRLGRARDREAATPALRQLL